MPQLDIFSWFNQVITTTCVMFIFYMLLILVFLPTTTAIVKGRTKLNQLRLLNLEIINFQITNYIKDTKENLVNLLINNFIPVYGYYFPVNNNQLNLTILRDCYNVNRVNLETLLLNYSLVNLVTTNNKIMEATAVNNVMISEEDLVMINKMITAK
jgi:hypothetical protein